MREININEITNEALKLRMQQIRTPEEVDQVMRNHKGTMLVYINSVCGCAGRIAYPALEMALQHPNKPDKIATIFATADREAIAQARTYFTNQPPSSPSFALMRDGQFIEMIHRADIETGTPVEIAIWLTEMFDKYCAPVYQV